MKITALKKLLKSERDTYLESLKYTKMLKQQVNDMLLKQSDSWWKKIVYKESNRGLQRKILGMNREEYLLQCKIDAYQNVALSLTNDGLIFPVNLRDILFSLHTAWKHSFRIDYLAKVFGFTIKSMEEYLKQGKISNKKGLFLKKLAIFFNKDGSFNVKQDPDAFWIVLDEVVETESLRETVLEVSDLTDEFYEVYKKAILDSIDEKDEKLSFVNSMEQEETNPLDKLRYYYSNYKLHHIPGDIEAFNDLLVQCKLDDKEINYIKKLIEEAKKVQFLNALDEEQKRIYQEAKERLNRMNPESSSYEMLAGLLSSIDGLLYAIVEKDITEVVGKARLKSLFSYLPGWYNEINTNNAFVFLEKDKVFYVLQDIDQYETGYRKRFKEALDTLSIDRVRISNIVMHGGTNKYPLYNCVFKDISIFVLLLPNDIFMIIGASIFGYGENEMLQRISENIDQINNVVQDTKTLMSKESILLFYDGVFQGIKGSLEKKEIQRKRKKD